MNICSKFEVDPCSCSCEEVKDVSANQRTWHPTWIDIKVTCHDSCKIRLVGPRCSDKQTCVQIWQESHHVC